MLTDPFGTSALTERIIGCGIRVHREIGPGVFESVYSECMEYEFRQDGLAFEKGCAVPVTYKGVRLRSRYFVDFVVENRVIVELKSVDRFAKSTGGRF